MASVKLLNAGLRTTMGDGGADFPAGHWFNAELRQRHRSPRAVGMPIGGGRGRNGGQLGQIVAHIERGVRLDKSNRGAYRTTDTGSFDDEIMLEPVDQPDTGRLLDNDKAEALTSGRDGRAFNLAQPRAIVRMGSASSFHA